MNWYKGFSSRIGGVLLHPRETFEMIVHEKRGLTEPVLLFLIITLVEGLLAGSVISRVIQRILEIVEVGSHIPSWIVSGIFSQVLPFSLVLVSVIGGFVNLILWSLINHLVARHLFDSMGSYEATLGLYMYTSVIDFLIILGLIVSLFTPAAGLLLTSTLAFVTLIWKAWLLVLITENVYGLDSGKALISAILIPLVIYLVVFPGLSLIRLLYMPWNPWRF